MGLLHSLCWALMGFVSLETHLWVLGIFCISLKISSPPSLQRLTGEVRVVTLLDHTHKRGLFLYRSLSRFPSTPCSILRPSLPSSAGPFLGSEGHVGLLLVNSHLSRWNPSHSALSQLFHLFFISQNVDLSRLLLSFSFPYQSHMPFKRIL